MQLSAEKSMTRSGRCTKRTKRESRVNLEAQLCRGCVLSPGFVHFATYSLLEAATSVRVRKCKIIIRPSYILREVLPFTQGVQACSPSAVGFAVCSSAAFLALTKVYEATQQSAFNAAGCFMSIWCDRLDLKADWTSDLQ